MTDVPAVWPSDPEKMSSHDLCVCASDGDQELVLCPAVQLCLASREHGAMLLILITFHGNVRMCLAVLAGSSVCRVLFHF